MAGHVCPNCKKKLAPRDGRESDVDNQTNAGTPDGSSLCFAFTGEPEALKVSESQDRVCAACGARVPDGNLVCPECARSVLTQSSIRNVSRPETVNYYRRTCPHCGAQGVLLTSENRCPECKKHVPSRLPAVQPASARDLKSQSTRRRWKLWAWLFASDQSLSRESAAGDRASAKDGRMSNFDYHEYFGDIFVFKYPSQWRKEIFDGNLVVVPTDAQFIAGDNKSRGELDLCIFLNILDCNGGHAARGGQTDFKRLPAGQLVRTSLQSWRDCSPAPYPGYKMLNQHKCTLHGAEEAVVVEFSYKIARHPFRGVVAIAEKNLFLFRLQVAGTKERFASLGGAPDEIVNSLILT